MVFKADVLQWFKELESYDRIELMHELLHMCLPFEIRFLGGCVEEVGKHSFQELRGPSIVANDIDKLAKDATQLSPGVLDRNCRHRMCVYLSLLENRNCQCAHWYFKQVFRTERFDECAMRQQCIDDGVVLNELLMVFTLGRLHPAFNYHQKEFFGDMLDKLYRIRTDKCGARKNPAQTTNYPPGFTYPNQIVPSSTIHQQPPIHIQQQVQPLDTLCIVKTSSSSSTRAVTVADDLTVGVATPTPPGLLTAPPQQQQQQQQYHHHPQQYEHVHTTYWRQQPMYTLADAQLMAPPPQPVSPLVSQCASPPPSRPNSPSPNPLPQQHIRSSTITTTQLRAPKTSPLEAHGSPQPAPTQMPSSTTVFLTPSIVHAQQSELVHKVGDNESNHALLEDVKAGVQQDWTAAAVTNHLHTAQFGFAQQHPHMAPNGLRQCFATNFQQHHAVMAMDQQQAMFGYDLDYPHQHINDIQLDNTLHRSGSSSNNSSNASSLNQSPPDTPSSTPTPAHHGPGRGTRDGIVGITEKLRVLNNVNSVSYLTPPPPISDGSVPQTYAANVPYAGFGGGRPIFGRLPSFGHSFTAPPPPLAPAQQHVHGAQAQVPTAYIMGPAYIVPTILASNGNSAVVPTHSSSTTMNAPMRSHQQQHQHTAGGALVGTSPTSAICCTFCCNCGSAEHRDDDCTVPHIDAIVTQVGYTLDYDDASGGGAGATAHAPATPPMDHTRPDI